MCVRERQRRREKNFSTAGEIEREGGRRCLQQGLGQPASSLARCELDGGELVADGGYKEEEQERVILEDFLF